MTDLVENSVAGGHRLTAPETDAGQPTRSTDIATTSRAAAADRPIDHKPILVDEFGAPTKEGWRKIGHLFQVPLTTRQRKGPGGRSFDYITARQVADRLDKVIGPGNWATSFRVLSVQEHTVECTLTVFGISKADVGYSNNPDSENESEPLKAAYSDALKRAAVHWGIGRWLHP
jgi:Rad52/22 family double-strand break repair protein